MRQAPQRRAVRDMTVEAIAPMPQREPEEADAVRRLKDDNLNLRIDNRAKETVPCDERGGWGVGQLGNGSAILL